MSNQNDVQDAFANLEEVAADKGEGRLPYFRPIHTMSNSIVKKGNWGSTEGDVDITGTVTAEMATVKYRLRLEVVLNKDTEDEETVQEYIYPEDCEGSWAQSDKYVAFMEKYEKGTYNMDLLMYSADLDAFGIHSVKQRRRNNFKAIMNASAPLSGVVCEATAVLKSGGGNRTWFDVTAVATDKTVDLTAHASYNVSVDIFDQYKD